MRLTIGAASARPGEKASVGFRSCLHAWKLTVGFPTSLVNAGADNHDIVDDGETTFATDPLAVLAHYIAVCQHCGGVHHHTLAVKFLCIGQLTLGEELPC